MDKELKKYFMRIRIEQLSNSSKKLLSKSMKKFDVVFKTDLLNDVIEVTVECDKLKSDFTIGYNKERPTFTKLYEIEGMLIDSLLEVNAITSANVCRYTDKYDCESPFSLCINCVRFNRMLMEEIEENKRDNGAR